MKLNYGATYYRLTYADPQLSMPGLKPIVYVGDNLFDDEEEYTTHYFQDTVSVLKFGLVDVANETTGIHVSSFSPDELGVSVVDIDDASKFVADAASRFKELGSPKLKQIKGKWV